MNNFIWREGDTARNFSAIDFSGVALFYGLLSFTAEKEEKERALGSKETQRSLHNHPWNMDLFSFTRSASIHH